MVPSNEPDETSVTRFNRYFLMKLPVAPANRPVPPVMVCASSIETTSGFAVGVASPVMSVARLSSLAAVKRLDPKDSKGRVRRSTSNS